jgi:formate hydrogenlyase transcriptional activator
MSSTSAQAKSPLPEQLPIERDPIRWALQEHNQEWYRELVEHSRDLLCVHDLRGRLLSVNPVPARLLGYSVEEMLQIPMREMIVPEYRDLFDLYLEQIERDGEAQGLMVVLSRSGERQVWEFHNTLHTAREGPPVVLGLAHDITERRKAEAQFQALLEAAPDAMVVVDPEARMMLVNAQVEHMFGYQREELLGQKIEMLVPERLRDRHCELRNDFFRTAQDMPTRVGREFLALHKDGHEFPVEINLSPLQTPEGLLVTSAIRDITERKQAEERLRQYEKAMEGLEEMITVVDRDYRYVIANRAFLKYRGLENEQLIGRHLAEVLNKRVFETVVKEKLDDALRGNVVRYEMKYNYAELGERDLSISYFPIEDQGRIDRVACVLQDITERKQAEEALRTSEREQHKIAEQLEAERARLIEAQAVAKVGSWEIELPSLDITWSEQTHRIFETDPSYFHPTRPGFMGLVHPEDRAKVDAAFEASLEKGAPSTVEYRIVMADGRVKVLEERWKVFHEGKGQPARLTGTCQDITERKKAEANLREVVEELRQAKEKLAEEKIYLEQEIDTELGFDEIVGQSPAMKNLMEQVGKVAGSDATVLLLGETGAGKELVARALHRLSQRAGNSFIKMNCAAIPSGLLESELFGYEKGAFTGAVSKKLGRLELADKGTLFLDEIGEIPLALQPKLLRVLQDQEFERLGGTQTLKVDFRLIAATNRDLAESVRKKEFRSDLYYRLNVFPVRVPPLRERCEDIHPLVEHFVQKFAKRMNKKITSIPKKTIDALMHWEWPGNVRELENFVERSVILTDGSVLVSPLIELEPPSEGAMSDTLEAAEREHILRALRESRGKIGGPRGAAARLGLKRTTLQSKLKQMGIDRHPPTSGH